MSDLIQDKLKDAETRFDTLQKEINGLQEKVNDGNKQISARREELVRLQGEYRVLKDLLKEESHPANKKEKKTG